MKDKIFGILQRVGRSFMLPIAILPVAGLLLGIGGSFTNETMLETYGLLGVMGPGTVLNQILQVMNAAGSFSAAAAPVAAKSKSSAAFEESLREFLAYYGRTTHLPVENGSYVRALWKKLSTRERELAYRKVEDYYFSLNNTHFCYQAAKYLEYRIFENEFVN